jgi:hypothetical protein
MVENLAVSFEQPLGAGREVLVGADVVLDPPEGSRVVRVGTRDDDGGGAPL